MSGNLPLVSIIIRSKNNFDVIKRNLEALHHQSYPQIEFYHVDSGSTDGTLDIIRRYAPQESIHQIPAEDYIPGVVLNEAVRQTHGEIVVFHNSDCVPLDLHYIEKLIEPLLKQEADITFANQHPRIDAELWVQKDYERAFGDQRVSKGWVNFFSLVSSACFRKDLEETQFSETLQYSEDIDWAYRMRQKGKRIRYMPEAHVEHSHNYTLKEIKVRFYNEGRSNYLIYGKVPSQFRGFLLPCIVENARDFVYALRRGRIGGFFKMIRPRWIQRYNIWKGAYDAHSEAKLSQLKV